jgi:hypothetical protein
MKQGVSVKVIGDLLGHRDIESTSVYLRLNVDDLRDVALSVPATFSGDPGKLVSLRSLPRIRPAPAVHNFAPHFRSRFATSLQRFIDLKRALGRIYAHETEVLRHWDDFVRRQHPQANKVRPEMFTEWAKTLTSMTSTGSHFCQRIVRNFLLFHVLVDKRRRATTVGLSASAALTRQLLDYATQDTISEIGIGIMRAGRELEGLVGQRPRDELFVAHLRMREQKMVAEVTGFVTLAMRNRWRGVTDSFRSLSAKPKPEA